MKRAWIGSLMVSAMFLGVQGLFGQHWTKADVPTNLWTSVACSSDGTKVVAAAFNSFKNYGLPGGPIVLSTNSGATWTLTTAPMKTWISIASSSDGTKFVAAVTETRVTHGEVWVSSDAGGTWQLSHPSNFVWQSVASSADGNKLVAVASGQVSGYFVYTSTNAGADWLLSAAPAENWQSVASSADGNKLAIAGGPLFTSTNAGVTWIRSSALTGMVDRVACSADGNTLIAGYFSNETPIYVSTNAGASWNKADVPKNDWTAVGASPDGATLLAGTSLGYVFQSTNSGQNWYNSARLFVFPRSFACSADGRKIFVTTDIDSDEGRIYVGRFLPRLSIVSAGTNSVLAWPLWADCVLESSSIAGPGASWARVTNQVVAGASSFFLTNQMDGSAAFFRLRE